MRNTTTNSVFLVALWGFSSFQGKSSKLGLDFDGMIFPVPKKNIKLFRLAFFVGPNYNELEILR
jgi:hypothetical protein